MDPLNEKFARLGVENAPGQEVRQSEGALTLRGEMLSGIAVDFSHGDVDAFEPIPGTLEQFVAGVQSGGTQAYTEYRGKASIREDMAQKLSAFTAVPLNAQTQVIITPGTQGALFLAMGSTFARGDKVAIVEPDYFANRKLVEFFDGRPVPVRLEYETKTDCAGLNLDALEDAFRDGVKLFLFSNPNNPTGVIYTPEEIRAIATLAQRYGAYVIADELYSRQVFDNRNFTHLCALRLMDPENLITVMGPSKTESLSGYRLGVAFGSSHIIDRMEKLQAIVSLRAGGYSQAVLKNWFNEPEGWMKRRIAAHQAIRDDLLVLLRAADGMSVRTAEAGSYLFPKLPRMDIGIADFCKILRLQAAVTVTPGIEFGPRYTDCFRINFSQDHQKAVSAIERTILIAQRYRA
jgi:aspartate/methionine/tyrosine aminotransferase